MYSDDSQESVSTAVTWIEWYCEMPKHRFFCEVERSFIEDKFNLYGLRTIVDNYDQARNRILDLDDESELDEGKKNENISN